MLVDSSVWNWIAGQLDVAHAACVDEAGRRVQASCALPRTGPTVSLRPHPGAPLPVSEGRPELCGEDSGLKQTLC